MKAKHNLHQRMKIKKLVLEWLNERGLQKRKYQIDAICDILSKINGIPVVLAACPGAGKTIMAQIIAELILNKNANIRIIILTHGTTILRTQFYNSLKDNTPDFTFKTVEAGEEIDRHAQALITLPHTIYDRDLSWLKKYKVFLIVDEAHHYYLAPMIQTIIKKIQPKHTLLLTGTPSPFVLRNYPMVVIPMHDLIKQGHIGNVSVELCATLDYTYGIGDINRGNEVKDSFNFKDTKTSATLTRVLDNVRNRTGLDGDWNVVLSQLCKSISVCRNDEQAKQTHAYFISKGVNCALSTYDADKKSAEVDRFIKDDSCTMLVVVYRGILGFDFPKLCNIIDLSGTGNIDRIFQMMSRLVRKHPDHQHTKTFFKVVPLELLEEWYRPIMNASMYLICEDGIRTYNGTNLDGMLVITRDMEESDCVEGKKFYKVLITGKRLVDGVNQFDIQVISKADGMILKEMKGILYTELIDALDLYNPKIRIGGPGMDKTTPEKWLANKKKQIPLNLISFQCFVDALPKHKKCNVYALTKVHDVYDMLNTYKREDMTTEERFDRAKKIYDEWLPTVK